MGELSAGIYGHSNEIIVDTIKKTVDNVGLSLGAVTAQEAVYAEYLCSRFSIERIRFTSSGTDANIHCLAAARRFTGKSKIVVFSNAYHGGIISFGHEGPAPNNVDQGDWIVVRYNDIAAVREAIKGDGVAAVLVEAMQGAAGAIPGTKDFLLAIQEAARESNVLFILDEVMTSRLAPGGLGSVYGLSPDLKCLGKYLGGGLAFGAFGGRADIMSVYDARNPSSLPHHGTFNNTTLAVHVGYAGVSRVYTPEVCTAFTALGERFLNRLKEVTKGTKCTFSGIGTLIAVHFSDSGRQTLSCKEDMNERLDLKDLFWLEMMEERFLIHRRGSIFLMLPTPEEELDRFVKAVAGFLEKHCDLVTPDV